MEAKAIVTYVVCDDTIKDLGIQEDPQSKMTMAEVMTTAIISSIQFFGNFEKARIALKNERYIPNMLSKSQFNRRLHRIGKNVWDAVLKRLYSILSSKDTQNQFIVDSFPLPACKFVRRYKSKLFKEKKYTGYCAAKDEFFLGFKMHMICDINRNPVEFLILPACESDVTSLKKLELNLPQNSSLLGDKAYNDYKFEDYLVQFKQIHLLPIRKKNSKRKNGGYLAGIRKRKRRQIETMFSCIEKLMSRSIHAVTINGYKLKSMLFVFGYAFTKLASMVTT